MSEPNRKRLDFTMIDQEHSLWCWAAVSESVAKFYTHRSPLTQCQIATEVIGDNANCCGNGDCNTDMQLELGLRETKNFKKIERKALEWEDVVAEILDERVICATIDWDTSDRDGPCHFVVIFGYSIGRTSGVKKVYIEDPVDAQGMRFMEFEEFKTNYVCTTLGRGGTWIESFLTIKPPNRGR